MRVAAGARVGRNIRTAISNNPSARNSLPHSSRPLLPGPPLSPTCPPPAQVGAHGGAERARRRRWVSNPAGGRGACSPPRTASPAVFFAFVLAVLLPCRRAGRSTGQSPPPPAPLSARPPPLGARVGSCGGVGGLALIARAGAGGQHTSTADRSTRQREAIALLRSLFPRANVKASRRPPPPDQTQPISASEVSYPRNRPCNSPRASAKKKTARQRLPTPCFAQVGRLTKMLASGVRIFACCGAGQRWRQRRVPPKESPPFSALFGLARAARKEHPGQIPTAPGETPTWCPGQTEILPGGAALLRCSCNMLRWRAPPPLFSIALETVRCFIEC